MIVYGKDCPVGKVQVEFVSTDGERMGEYGWLPGEKATIDIWVDGKRFLVQAGSFYDHQGTLQRGVYVVSDHEMDIERGAMNSVNLRLKPSICTYCEQKRHGLCTKMGCYCRDEWHDLNAEQGA